MDKEKIKDSIQDVKKDVSIWYRSAPKVADLAGKAIDRPHPVNLWELSDRELDAWMGDQLTLLNESLDPRPDPGEITSHRRIIGPVIVRIKRFIMKVLNVYTHTILERQRLFNTESVAMHLSSFIRIRRIQTQLDDILRRMAEQHEADSLRGEGNEKEGPSHD